jgi:hypothetical protein
VRGTGRWLALFAATVVIGHHVGTVFKPLGTVGPTEWADWIDLAVPVVVLGTATAVLSSGGAPRRAWLVFLAGAVAYVEGHGLHLAANSISNAGPSGRAADAAHLWDEVVSHHLWYAGLAAVVAALALAVAGSDLAVPAPAYALAALFGLTATTNAIEGGTAVLSLAVAAGFVAWGWRRRDRGSGRLLLSAYAVSFVLLVVWGVWHQGFPQFSELGWI